MKDRGDGTLIDEIESRMHVTRIRIYYEPSGGGRAGRKVGRRGERMGFASGRRMARLASVQ